MVRASAGATVANVACAFDVLGFALELPADEVVVEAAGQPGVHLRSVEGDGGKLPREPEKNTAGIALLSFLRALDSTAGVSLLLKKGMPLGSGLGSSAASAVAAVAAANELFGSPFTAAGLLPFVLDAEEAACGTRHADNAAPALFGGFVLIRSAVPPEIIPLRNTPPLACAVWHPHFELSTRDSRSVLPRDVPFGAAVRQWGNVASLIAGLLQHDYDLIGRSLEDRIVEPARAPLIPRFAELKRTALDHGALGCSISGAGPSIFALCRTIEEAKTIGAAFEQRSTGLGVGCDIFLSGVNTRGPKILEAQ
jgi:homoserine kinase